ncbi:MAG: PQQ-dependent sugar dehydrogenase [Planctomycetes bacterium]|nr:PQQ-dependent sugar dehydrogenase [Planctomycetota bacterium]
MHDSSFPLVALVAALVLATPGFPVTAEDGGEYRPPIAPASREGELAMQGFRLPEGMTAQLVAAEPMLANPVAFSIDERGRFYVCETFRQQKGVEDNRNHMHWLNDDLAARTVEDRLRYFQKHLGARVEDYAREHDRIRLLEDTDGDGRADKSTVFADGFSGILEGTGAGVLAHQGDVFYTCIPRLWKLRDWTGDGIADTKRELHYGYGVKVAFRGHDLHGLTLGPDGRLYFTIGDRGFNVGTLDGRRLAMPDTGAVLRCELDGSDLEIFCYGLRNPQELAFDDYGNLFTVDNNSDSGDEARLLYLVEGADYGWRMYYQYLDDRGPWNREQMWQARDVPPLAKGGPGGVAEEGTAADGQAQGAADPPSVRRGGEAAPSLNPPAYIIPPIANISDGPAGLVHYPGVGLPERYKGHFFLADFRGASGQSGIRSFAVEPHGAGFRLVDDQEFVWNVLATDVDFGWDGSLYVTDWVNGWDGEGKGRLYRFTHTEAAKAAVAARTAEFIGGGFARYSVDELAGRLAHPDRRVRLSAQFELVTRGAVEKLMDVANTATERLARVHAIWGLAQHHRQSRSRQSSARLHQTILALLKDEDAEIQVTVLRAFRNAAMWFDPALDDRLRRDLDRQLRHLIYDPRPRVRYFALSAGNVYLHQLDQSAFILESIANAGSADPLVRHAAVMGLAACKGSQNWQELSKTVRDARSTEVRLTLLQFLRHSINRASPKFAQEQDVVAAIARFLTDDDPRIVLEAARLTNDLPVPDATPNLAAMIWRPGLPDPLLRRVLNANFRLGGQENARDVAAIAANADVSEPLRLEALEELRLWNEPPPIDRVTGMWRPIKSPGLRLEKLVEAIRPFLGGILAGPVRVREAGVRLAAHYGIREVGPVLFTLVTDAEQPPRIRVEALFALDALEDERLAAATDDALESDAAELRAAGRRLLAKLRPDDAVPALAQALQNGETVERQAAADVLASMKTPAADRLLGEWLERLVSAEAPPEIQLDLIQAAQKRGTADMKDQLARFEAARPAGDPLAGWRETLAGGDAERGLEIFFGRTAVSCRRCHKIDGTAGEVGPDLSKIGREKTREYLLTSLVDPNKEIAKGYETVVLVTVSGRIYTGVVKADDERRLQLMTAEGALVSVPKDQIEDRAAGKSSMPADLVKHLSKADLRDLVEYLVSLRAE